MVSDGFFWLFKVPGWFFTVPGGFYGFSRFQISFFYCTRPVFMVFQGSRFVFHGSKWVFMVFQGFRLVFRGSRLVLRVDHGSRFVFIVTGRFL